MIIAKYTLKNQTETRTRKKTFYDDVTASYDDPKISLFIEQCRKAFNDIVEKEKLVLEVVE